MAKKKSCYDCENYWRQGTGYSDWTWMETHMRCFIGVHPEFPKEEPYEEKDAPEFAYAEKCEHFSDNSYDGVPPLVSPDGHLSEGADRAAAILYKASK
jgi:hypothetical protein